VSDELFDFLLLLRRELFLVDLAVTKGLQQTSHVLDEDVIARDHYLLLLPTRGRARLVPNLRDVARSIALSLEGILGG